MVRTKIPKKRAPSVTWRGTRKRRVPTRSTPAARTVVAVRPPRAIPEKDGHPGSGSDEVKLKVSRFLFPIELACHAPTDVHPVGDHRPAQDRKAREFLGSADGPIDVDIGRDLEEGEEHVEDDPALFSPDPDEPRIGPAH